MEKWSKDLLTSRMVELATNLEYAELLPYLQSRGILRDHQVETVRAHLPYRARQELIGMVKRGGRDSFYWFCRGLYETRQYNLLQELFPNLKDHHQPIPSHMDIAIARKPDGTAYIRFTPLGSGGTGSGPPAIASAESSPDDLSSSDEELGTGSPHYPPRPNDREITRPAYMPRTAIRERGAYGKVEETQGVMINMVVEEVDNSRAPIYFNAEEIYRNFSDPKGLALIVNNSDFSKSRARAKSLGRPDLGLLDRAGSNVDCHNAELLFKELGYSVKLKHNLTTEQMIKAVERFSRKDGHGSCDSLVVVLLSHGDHGLIHGTEGGGVQIDQLLSYFTSQRCPNMAGKPKLFFIQACRGKTYDGGCHEFVDTGGAGDPIGLKGGQGVTESDANKCSETTKTPSLGDVLNMDQVDAQEMRQKLPNEADFLIAYSTVPGYVSWRNAERGSWFIQGICEVFCKYAHTEGILDLLTRVNDRVAKAFQSGSGFKQIPEPSSRLRKKFFFFPGLKNAPSFDAAPIVPLEPPTDGVATIAIGKPASEAQQAA